MGESWGSRGGNNNCRGGNCFVGPCEEVRPYLIADGGNVDVVGVEDGRRANNTLLNPTFSTALNLSRRRYVSAVYNHLSCIYLPLSLYKGAQVKLVRGSYLPLVRCSS